ncbi:hypothetical protein GCM10009539_47470 [Cryptosporangium japonicum]|uniref:Uncharacterized protein n=1 Tax=Cryptosporangium japonicum TaxID=80872 RepID=A0ABP3EBZ2_9ACTN
MRGVCPGRATGVVPTVNGAQKGVNQPEIRSEKDSNLHPCSSEPSSDGLAAPPTGRTRNKTFTPEHKGRAIVLFRDGAPTKR